MMLLLRGAPICRCTMPSTVSRSIPLASAAWKAASRLGTLNALRARPAQRVAGAAGLHELRLAVREVRLVAPTGARDERNQGDDEGGQDGLHGVTGEAHRARTLSAQGAGWGSRSSFPRAAEITPSATLSQE